MSAQITVHVADTQRSVAQGTTAGELFEGDRSVLVARVDGELRDLAHVLVGSLVIQVSYVDVHLPCSFSFLFPSRSCHVVMASRATHDTHTGTG